MYTTPRNIEAGILAQITVDSAILWRRTTYFPDLDASHRLSHATDGLSNSDRQVVDRKAAWATHDWQAVRIGRFGRFADFEP